MKRLIIILTCIFFAFPSWATHIIGAEIGYKHISGLQYEINVNIYGDCNLDASVSSYPTFYTAGTAAKVFIFNGTTLIDSIVCAPYGDFGKEITPVCDKDSNNTRCKSMSGTVPGITEFKFKATYTLGGTSSNWRFAFLGDLLTSLAGRTGSITNLDLSNGTVVFLEARLDNTGGVNSSAELTTIPTPFFCINQQQQYNPGAIDADGDSLNVRLVNALLPNGNSSWPISYNLGYSPTQPVSASSFTFNNQNGQLNFVPNLVQISSVVYMIEEYRNGQQIGSMMREMNLLVLNNCSNQSPGGFIDSANTGSISGGNVIEVCNADSVITFSITATDPDSGNIKAILSGVPNGMTYTLTGNNTKTVKIDFVFTIPLPIVPGAHNFFITYQDDNCPISSKQQIAYTVKVVNPINFTYTTISESCKPGNDGIINIAATSTNTGNLEYAFNGGSYGLLNTFTGLPAASYPTLIKDGNGCWTNVTIKVDTATKVYIDSILTTDISCFGKRDGKMDVRITPATLNTSFEVNPGSLVNASGVFTNLGVGNYTIIANAPLGCSDTAVAQLNSPPPISFNNIVIEDNICDLRTGRIEIKSNSTIPVAYSISPNQQTNSYGQFGGLIAGYYIITALDSNGCYKDTILKVNDAPNNFGVSFTKQDVSCASDGNDGWVEAHVFNGVPPYTYQWQLTPTPTETSARITNQRSGVKRLFVTDAIGCKTEGYIIVNPANCCEQVFIPSAFSPNGDGQNETFNLRTPLTMKDVNFFVVNRWGQKVWQTNNHLDSWDGTYSNGKYADVGTYFYYLTYRCDKDETNKVYKLKGDLTLLR